MSVSQSALSWWEKEILRKFSNLSYKDLLGGPAPWDSNYNEWYATRSYVKDLHAASRRRPSNDSGIGSPIKRIKLSQPANPGFPQLKNMPRIANPVNAQAGRASMKMKNKKNEKVKSIKRVKVSKNLREKVKKVIAGVDAYGAYYTRIGGAVGYIDPGADATIQRTYAYGRDSAYVAAQWAATNFSVGSKCWFGSLCFNNPSISSNADRCLTYFTPLKILNAASVLWNGKAAAADPTIVANNFSVATTTATGLPNIGSSQFPSTGPLEIRVINSYVMWRMKNVSQRTLLVKVYNCVPKLKFTQVSPLGVLQAVSDVIDSSTVRRQMTATPVGANGTIPSAIMCNPLFEPSSSPQFNMAYKYSLMTMVIKPGEECIHTIQGPKNYTLDYNKLNPEGNSEIGSFFKDTTISCMVSVELDATYATTAVDSQTGQWYNKTAAVAANLTCPLSIEVDEVFKLSCPKTTGFISRAAAAGTIQMLNLKNDRIVYANFNNSPAVADTYSNYNEENPGAAIVESNVN